VLLFVLKVTVVSRVFILKVTVCVTVTVTGPSRPRYGSWTRPRPPHACVAERFLLPPSSRSSARATRSPIAHGQRRDALGRGWPAAARAWRVPRCPGACARKDRSPPPVPRWRTRSRGMCVQHGLNSCLCSHTRYAAFASAVHGKQPRRRRTRRTRWHRACRSEAHQGNFPPC
jgi:hypothetical protein